MVIHSLRDYLEGLGYRAYISVQEHWSELEVDCGRVIFDIRIVGGMLHYKVSMAPFQFAGDRVGSFNLDEPDSIDKLVKVLHDVQS